MAGLLRYEIIRFGRRFRSIDTRILCDFINGFVAENALIMVDKKMSVKDEKEFQLSKAKEIDEKRTIFALCWDGNKLIGNSTATKDIFKQSHNATFGLVVRKGYRGMGIGENLLAMAIKEAKAHLKAKCLWLGYVDGNEPARKLYNKLGFVECARLKKYIKHGGKYRDKIIMECVK